MREKTVKINGAVHRIRNMGDVAFVILRKSEGLVQCVYEEGSCSFSLKNLKEEGADVRPSEEGDCKQHLHIQWSRQLDVLYLPDQLIHWKSQ